MTVTGKVKWYDEAKGYGFIARDDGGGDVFLRRNAIHHHRVLSPGQCVEFDVVLGRKSPAAANVRLLAAKGA